MKNMKSEIAVRNILHATSKKLSRARKDMEFVKIKIHMTPRHNLTEKMFSNHYKHCTCGI
jgi:hypothetical protein